MAGLVAAAVGPAAVPAVAKAALGVSGSAAALAEPGVPAGQAIEGREVVPRKRWRTIGVRRDGIRVVPFALLARELADPLASTTLR